METNRTAEDILSEKGSELISVDPDTPIKEAVKRMAEKRIGAMLVTRGGKIVGIWTERDLLQDTAAGTCDIASDKIGDFMTTTLHSASHDSPIDVLADMILGLRVRHLLIEREGQFIGLLSSGDVLRAGLQLRTEQWKQLEQIVHLQYYDHWKWKTKKMTKR